MELSGGSELAPLLVQNPKEYIIKGYRHKD